MEEIQPLEKTEMFTGPFMFLESITTNSHESKLKDSKIWVDEVSDWKGLYMHFSNVRHLWL